MSAYWDKWQPKTRHGPWIPKYIRANRVNGYAWAHEMRYRYYVPKVPRNRFMRLMHWRHEGCGMERWRPRGMPFMENHLVPRAGRLENLRWWRW